ncbi:hypothetical protein C9J21_18460 [Photobacterium phosphoreum]|uniref:hypothetical protein n=1 Tax=Photobacterium phosphoreum TaxID=659 RepID=UPI000D16DB26|nr:hypothetical protein [Photobacterium phosphoreum]PSW30788.1 hypothetical protein C9J21_18460 [Photobacterium phosphoreum]
MSKGIDAWNATVIGAAQSGSLSLILASIYTILYLIIGGWLLINLQESIAKKKLKMDEAGLLAGRWLALMIFTFYFLT